MSIQFQYPNSITPTSTINFSIEISKLTLKRKGKELAERGEDRRARATILVWLVGWWWWRLCWVGVLL